MPLYVDLAGQRFGRLEVIERVINEQDTRHVFYLCRCDCGETKVARSETLRRGKTLSCGCLYRESRSRCNRIHGQSHHTTKDGVKKGTRTYKTWTNMIRRCHSPNATNYPYYGGRGIKVCDRWRNSFALFLRDMGERPVGMTIDRMDQQRQLRAGKLRLGHPF